MSEKRHKQKRQMYALSKDLLYIYKSWIINKRIRYLWMTQFTLT